ncbi:hypothetical protein D3C79_1016130 [compost metagenome]
MTGQSGKGAEITLRTRIGGNDLEHRATGHPVEFHLGLEQRQGAIEATGVELNIMGYSVDHCITPGQVVELPRISGRKAGVRLQ